MSGFPSEFLSRLQQIIPADLCEGVFRSFAAPKSVAFRVNRLLGQVDTVLPILRDAGLICQPVPWLPEAFIVPVQQRELLTRHELVVSGSIYIHNPSSMLAALILDPQPEETVLDMAAAPGGKTLHLADRMQGTGFLSAVEAVSSRFYKLKENLRRGGAAYVRTFLMDGRQVPRKTGPRFDRILLDAPCSGEARFHVAEPDSYEKWSLRKIRECARKQAGLIQAALAALRPGGRLLYCTCSFAPEENEAMVEQLLQKHPDTCRLLEIELPLKNFQAGLPAWGDEAFSSSMHRCRRILPNADHDALFLALIEKLD